MLNVHSAKECKRVKSKQSPSLKLSRLQKGLRLHCTVFGLIHSSFVTESYLLAWSYMHVLVLHFHLKLVRVTYFTLYLHIVIVISEKYLIVTLTEFPFISFINATVYADSLSICSHLLDLDCTRNAK